MNSFPSNIPSVPAPWSLKGEAYWFVLGLFGKSSEALPSGNFSPFEAKSKQLGEEAGAWKGGPAMIMLLRYKESSIGPYDELVMVPGYFTAPIDGAALNTLRITRIYVSTLASVANGRQNWGIPKHLAKFEFTPSGNELGVRVYSTTNETGDISTFSSTPFFAAQFTPWSLPLPSIPYSTSLLPFDTTLIQPALEQSQHPEEDGLVGTNAWRKVLPSFTGKIKPVSWKGLLDGGKLGDGVHFPDTQPWRTVIHWVDISGTFSPAEVL